MSPAVRGQLARFRVRLDGQSPGAAHGLDADTKCGDAVAEQRLYQLIRRPRPVAERQAALHGARTSTRLQGEYREHLMAAPDAQAGTDVPEPEPRGDRPAPAVRNDPPLRRRRAAVQGGGHQLRDVRPHLGVGRPERPGRSRPRPGHHRAGARRLPGGGRHARRASLASRMLGPTATPRCSSSPATVSGPC